MKSQFRQDELVPPVYLPGDMWDYDEEGSHILIDTGYRRPAAQDRDPSAARNGFLYTFRARQRADR